MPNHELFTFREVVLNPPLKAILSRPGFRLECQRCGEEIINERQVMVDGQAFCRTCANQGYYFEARTTGVPE
jgi:formylmethanofuran dehydrogenase subunit E